MWMHGVRLVLAVACAGLLAAQRVVFVKLDATGNRDGTSWANAFVDLQAALASSRSGDEVWVAQGSHAPAGRGGSQVATFALRDGVALFGGFAGTESSRAQRDPRRYVTVLTGDLNGDDGPNWSGMQENSDHVVTANGVGSGAVLDGFVVRGGYVVHGGGAAMLISGASPTVRNCELRGSVANFSRGGGVGVAGNSTPRFEDCVVAGNYAHLGRGGGIAVGSGGNVALLRCRLEANRATGSTTDGNGGGVYLDLGTQLVAEECRFLGNAAELLQTSNGYPASGGAIASLADRVELTRCLLTGNRSDAGGALYLYRGTTRLESCTINANRAVKQSTAGGFGGAIVTSFQSVTTLAGCTIHANTATEDAGGVWGNSSTGSCQLVDCIVWGNRDSFGQVSESQVKSTKQHHCCVMNMMVSRPGEDPIDPTKFPNCFDKDPQFVAPLGADGVAGTEDDDFRLRASSPCVDAGDPTTGSSSLDLVGGLRLLDGDLDGVMTGDLGSSEFAHARLTVAVDALRLVRIDVTGTPALPAALFVGAPTTPVLVRPFGALWFDLGVSFSVPLGSVPATWSATAPGGTFDLVLQGLVAGAQGAQLTNPVALALR